MAGPGTKLAEVAEGVEGLIHAWVSRLLRQKQDASGHGRTTVEITFRDGKPTLVKFNDEVTHKT